MTQPIDVRADPRNYIITVLAVGFIVMTLLDFRDYRTMHPKELTSPTISQPPPDCALMQVNDANFGAALLPCPPLSERPTSAMYCQVLPADDGMTLVVECPNYTFRADEMRKKIVLFETGDRP